MENKGALADPATAAKALGGEASAPPTRGEKYYVPGVSPIEIWPRGDGRLELSVGGSAVSHSASLGEAREAAYKLAVRTLEREVSNAKHKILVCERTLGLLGRDDPFMLGRFMDGEEG